MHQLPTTSRHKALWPTRIIIVVVASAVCMHIGMIFIAGMPPNPLKRNLGFVRTYTHPLFIQSWAFFANPSRGSIRLWVKPADAPTSAYVDVTAALAAPVYENRLTPAALRLETFTHALQPFVRQPNDAAAREVVERTAACVIEPSVASNARSMQFHLEVRRIVPYRRHWPRTLVRDWSAIVDSVACP